MDLVVVNGKFFYLVKFQPQKKEPFDMFYQQGQLNVHLFIVNN